jgi:hypothetical protein
MVTWLVVALILQAVGSVISWWEVRQAYRRWHDEFRAVQPAKGHAVSSMRSTGWAVGESPIPEDWTVKQRLAHLEERQKRDHEAVVRRLRGVETSIPTIAAEQATKVEQRLQPQIGRTLSFLAGMEERHKWMPWWLGPGLLILGTLVSGVVSVVAAVQA